MTNSSAHGFFAGNGYREIQSSVAQPRIGGACAFAARVRKHLGSMSGTSELWVSQSSSQSSLPRRAGGTLRDPQRVELVATEIREPVFVGADRDRHGKASIGNCGRLQLNHSGLRQSEAPNRKGGAPKGAPSGAGTYPGGLRQWVVTYSNWPLRNRVYEHTRTVLAPDINCPPASRSVRVISEFRVQGAIIPFHCGPRNRQRDTLTAMP